MSLVIRYASFMLPFLNLVLEAIFIAVLVSGVPVEIFPSSHMSSTCEKPFAIPVVLLMNGLFENKDDSYPSDSILAARVTWFVL